MAEQEAKPPRSGRHAGQHRLYIADGDYEWLKKFAADRHYHVQPISTSRAVGELLKMLYQPYRSTPQNPNIENGALPEPRRSHRLAATVCDAVDRIVLLGACVALFRC